MELLSKYMTCKSSNSVLFPTENHCLKLDGVNCDLEIVDLIKTETELIVKIKAIKKHPGVFSSVKKQYNILIQKINGNLIKSEP